MFQTLNRNIWKFNKVNFYYLYKEKNLENIVYFQALMPPKKKKKCVNE